MSIGPTSHGQHWLQRIPNIPNQPQEDKNRAQQVQVTLLDELDIHRQKGESIGPRNGRKKIKKPTRSFVNRTKRRDKQVGQCHNRPTCEHGRHSRGKPLILWSRCQNVPRV